MKIIVLNTCLMIVVLFYVYPLKFLLSFLVKISSIHIKSLLFGERHLEELRSIGQIIGWSDMPSLMTIYNTGYIAIFVIFVLMYREAFNRSDTLQLNHVEQIKTKSVIAHYMGIIAIGVVSTIIAIFGLIIHWPWVGVISGPMYFLIGPVSYFISKRYERQLSSVQGGVATT